MSDDPKPWTKMAELLEPVSSIRMPKAAVVRPPPNPTFADIMYNRLVHAIDEFERDLAKDEEVGAKLASFGQAVTITIEGLGFHNPYVMKFHGRTLDGDRCTLVQHVSQLNVLLVALKTTNPEPRRIGFELMKQIEKGEAKE